jgi:hypothetical protein
MAVAFLIALTMREKELKGRSQGQPVTSEPASADEGVLVTAAH